MMSDYKIDWTERSAKEWLRLFGHSAKVNPTPELGKLLNDNALPTLIETFKNQLQYLTSDKRIIVLLNEDEINAIVKLLDSMTGDLAFVMLCKYYYRINSWSVQMLIDAKSMAEVQRVANMAEKSFTDGMKYS